MELEEGRVSRNETGWLRPRERDFGTGKSQWVTTALERSFVLEAGEE